MVDSVEPIDEGQPPEEEEPRRGFFSRRKFLLTGAAVGGGLIVGFALWPEKPWRHRMNAAGNEHILNAWLTIDTDGAVTVYVPFSEMGQGVHTSIPMVVADELGADWDRVSVEQAPADAAHVTPELIYAFVPLKDMMPEFTFGGVDWLAGVAARLVGLQVTGGSASTRGTWNTMRTAGAAAREMLKSAAAARWQVDMADLVAADHKVVHLPTGTEASYGELAAEAALQEAPEDPPFKDRSEYKFIGRSMPRLDTPIKTDGSAIYGIDVKVPGMRYAAIRHSPVFGGTVTSIDEAAISGIPGVEAIVDLGNSVAVVATRYWTAKKALAQLPITFDGGAHANTSSADVFADISAAIDAGDASVSEDIGDIAAAEGVTTMVSHSYQVPYLAHATMEPMNCTVAIKQGKCDVWASTQVPIFARDAAAEAAGLSSDDVTMHTTLLGGGFGRRLTVEFVSEAAEIAARTNLAVKLIWSREEDMACGIFRPAFIARMEAGLDANGQIVTWRHVANSAVMTDSEGAVNLPYDIPNRQVAFVETEHPVATGEWRSVGHSQNGFITEAFMNDLAAEAGVDPVEFRRRHLQSSPRHLAVLEKAASEAGWGNALPEGHERGIALHESFGTIVAEIAEVSLDAGQARVHKVTCVVDCGMAINPDTIRAQIEGGMVYGLTAALYGEITLKNGAVEQSNFPDYEMLSLADMPEVDVHIIESGAAMGGIGEPGTPPIAPAVVNALYRLTGKSIRTLPIRNHDLSVT